MPVRRIDVKDYAAPREDWGDTDFIVALFGLSMPVLAVCLIFLTR